MVADGNADTATGTAAATKRNAIDDAKRREAEIESVVRAARTKQEVQP